MHLPGDISMTRRAFSAISKKAWFLVALFPWRTNADESCCPFNCRRVCAHGCCSDSGLVCYLGKYGSGSWYYSAAGACCLPVNGCFRYNVTVKANCCDSPSYAYATVCCQF